uniref:Merozoite surface protein 7 n=1 Tax=Plasmodium cynomolgi TaxID=5827 RepID=A0A1L2DWU0_9APIC|nr:merozoite surface protein 7 [Plasmodium cynomolgi]
MKSGIVLVSCLLVLCAGPILGEENKRENLDKNNDDELKTLKCKLKNLGEQFKGDDALKKITEEQIATLKKKFEELRNKKSDQEAKLASRRGDTSPGDKDELGPNDEIAGQSINDSDNDEVIMVSRSSEGASGQRSEPAAEASPHSDNFAEQVNHVDLLFDELLTANNKKHMMDEGEHHSAYNNFRKQYDHLIINHTEYGISLKLLDAMLSSGKIGEERKNVLVETFKKAMYDQEYSEKFKSLIYGVYLFAKRNNFLDVEKVKGEEYDKLFDYVGNLINTLEV